jgi:lysozyme
VRWGIFIVLLLLSPFYYGYVLKSVVFTWRWMRQPRENLNYRVYKSYNIHMPMQYSIHGIDVSSYQGTINWKLVRAMHQDSVHVTFAFIKATEGIVQVDPFYQRNWREATKAGIICGAYHYFRPKFGGKLQARFFLQTIKEGKNTLPPVVDVEELGGMPPETMRRDLADFLSEVTEKTKRKPIIYTGLKFYADYLEGYFKDYTFWIASYNNPDLVVSTGANWKFWQHSDRAHVNGIVHGVDFDAFNGDSLAFRKLVGGE